MFANLKRREFLYGLSLATAGLLAKDFIYPFVASADTSQANSSTCEKYLVFVPYTTAKQGGTQTVILYSGKPYSLSIPTHCKNHQTIEIQDNLKQNNDYCFELYTLYDPKIRIADKIYEEINRTSLKQELSKECCITIYEQIEEGKFVDNLKALDLLDYVVNTSNLDENIRKSYKLASNNSRIIGLSQAINQTLTESNLTENDKTSLLGTFELVKAGQLIPDFNILTNLDAIVAGSAIPEALKQTYVMGSAISRGLTVDYLIVTEINNNKQLSAEKKEKYLVVYQELRKNNKSSDLELAKEFDRFIFKQSNLPANAQLVYLEARREDLSQEQDFVQMTSRLKEKESELQRTYNLGAAVTPRVTQLLSLAGTETATGVSISSLAGAAATNSTLAFLGGGSVAAGGLGMLGGLAVVTGGAALIGAAGLVGIALVSQMDQKDYQNLGIAISGGTLAGMGTVLLAWTAASALGVAGTLTGAAAISATIAALGGLSVMTGGAALVASGAGYVIWSILQSNKKRDQASLEQLETRMYASVIFQ